MAKIYNPFDYIVTVGDLPISGFAAGTFIKITPTAELAKTKIGAQGDAVVILSQDDSATAEITLLPTSDSNDDLSAMASALKAQVIRGDGIVTFMMKDLNGATVVHCDASYVSKYPDIQGGDDAYDRVWPIMLTKMDIFVGGTDV